MSFIHEEILRLLRTRKLKEPFNANSIRRASRLLRNSPSLGTFLPKHRVGNPQGETELYIRIPDEWGGDYKIN